MAVVLAAAVGVVGLVALVLWHIDRQHLDRIVANLVRQRFVVTLKSGETFDGVLTEADTHTLLLLSATSVAPGRDPIPVDGVLILSRADIAYMQRP